MISFAIHTFEELLEPSWLAEKSRAKRLGQREKVEYLLYVGTLGHLSEVDRERLLRVDFAIEPYSHHFETFENKTLDDAISLVQNKITPFENNIPASRFSKHFLGKHLQYFNPKKGIETHLLELQAGKYNGSIGQIPLLSFDDKGYIVYQLKRQATQEELERKEPGFLDFFSERYHKTSRNLSYEDSLGLFALIKKLKLVENMDISIHKLSRHTEHFPEIPLEDAISTLESHFQPSATRYGVTTFSGKHDIMLNLKTKLEKNILEVSRGRKQNSFAGERIIPEESARFIYHLQMGSKLD